MKIAIEEGQTGCISATEKVDETTRNAYLSQDHAASSASYPSNRESRLKDKKWLSPTWPCNPFCTLSQV